jgi:hypothetical protein
MRRHSPLALPNPNEIVVIAAEPKGDETGDFQFSFSTEQMQDFQERAGSFSAVVGLMPRLGGLVADGKASKFWFAAVSDNYFTVSASGRRRARSSPAGPARRCVAVSEAQAAVDVLMTTSPTSTPRAIRASPPSWCRSRSRGHSALGPHQGPPGVNRIPILGPWRSPGPGILSDRPRAG